MRLFTALLLCLCVLTPGALFGQGKIYFEAGFGSGSVESDGVALSDSQDSRLLWGGYTFSSNFSVEAGYGNHGDTFSHSPFELITAGIKGRVPLAGGVILHAKVGMALLDAPNFGSKEEKGIYYGIGASYFFDNIAYGTVDYFAGDIEDYDVSVVSLGIGFVF